MEHPGYAKVSLLIQMIISIQLFSCEGELDETWVKIKNMNMNHMEGLARKPMV